MTELSPAQLAAEIHHFISGYQQIRGLDPEFIYRIHAGSELEAELRISRLQQIAKYLRRLQEPEGPTDEEVEAWVDQQGFIRGHGDHPCGFWIDDDDAGALVRAALARWGQVSISP